jgi:hypothetical protein
MGHLLVSSMKKIRAAMDQLTLEKDGVDGAEVYIYGEEGRAGCCGVLQCSAAVLPV